MPKNQSLRERFRTFPRATGFLAEIMAAHEAGILSSEEAAEWMLEYATGKPKLEWHTAVQHRSVTRQRANVDDGFVEWCVSQGVRLDTARQYAHSLRGSPEHNVSQYRAAEKLYRAYTAS